MSLAAVPLSKLFWLGVRQAARPIANVAVRAAQSSTRFHDICIQASKIVPSQRANIPDQQAVQIGSQVLSEAVVFGVSSAVLLYEFQRGKEAERTRAQAERDTLKNEMEAYCNLLRSESCAAQKELRDTILRLETEIASLRKVAGKPK
mmetsp:Transcript_32594/g.76469  ORF Transcript_32594/g.76469 Transcript_32594/m.76469 type:complete len:148 (-) Transcript_32594:63-506(-)